MCAASHDHVGPVYPQLPKGVRIESPEQARLRIESQGDIESRINSAVKAALAEQAKSTRPVLQVGEEAAFGPRPRMRDINYLAFDTESVGSGTTNRRRGHINVKSEITWPTFSGNDPFYTIEDYMRAFSRVSKLVGGGQPVEAYEEIELLRSGVLGTAGKSLDTFIDTDPGMLGLLASEDHDARLARAWRYLRKEFGRPTYELQKMARADYNKVDMRYAKKPFMEFLAEYRAACANLKRVGIVKSEADLRLDLLEKLPADVTAIVVTHASHPESTEDIIEIARVTLAAQTMGNSKVCAVSLADQEAIAVVRAKGSGKGDGSDQVFTCRYCQGVGHAPSACPSLALSGEERQQLSADASRLSQCCRFCGATDHRHRHHTGGGTTPGAGGAGQKSSGKGVCRQFQSSGSCSYGQSCKYAHTSDGGKGNSEPRRGHAHKGGHGKGGKGGAGADRIYMCSHCDKEFTSGQGVRTHMQQKHAEPAVVAPVGTAPGGAGAPAAVRPVPLRLHADQAGGDRVFMVEPEAAAGALPSGDTGVEVQRLGRPPNLSRRVTLRSTASRTVRVEPSGPGVAAQGLPSGDSRAVSQVLDPPTRTVQVEPSGRGVAAQGLPSGGSRAVSHELEPPTRTVHFEPSGGGGAAQGLPSGDSRAVPPLPEKKTYPRGKMPTNEKKRRRKLKKAAEGAPSVCPECGGACGAQCVSWGNWAVAEPASDDNGDFVPDYDPSDDEAPRKKRKKRKNPNQKRVAAPGPEAIVEGAGGGVLPVYDGQLVASCESVGSRPALRPLTGVRVVDTPAPGYNYEGAVFVAGLPLQCLWDGGACSSLMPEYVFEENMRKADGMSASDSPVLDVVQYREPIPLRGFTGGEPVFVKYEAVIKVGLVQQQGAQQGASISVRFKICPGATTTIMGGETLDGLGFRTSSTLWAWRSPGRRARVEPASA